VQHSALISDIIITSSVPSEIDNLLHSIAYEFVVNDLGEFFFFFFFFFFFSFGHRSGKATRWYSSFLASLYTRHFTKNKNG
jgi:hypothetical protein